jgi:hypothetical protein
MKKRLTACPGRRAIVGFWRTPTSNTVTTASQTLERASPALSLLCGSGRFATSWLRRGGGSSGRGSGSSLKTSMRYVLLGLVLLALSVSLLGLTIWRFQWLQRHVPFLLRWGRGRWSYPASRVGVIAGSIVGVTIAGLCFDSRFELLSRGAWGSILITMLLLVVAAAIHDYRHYKRGASKACSSKGGVPSLLTVERARPALPEHN